MTTNLRAPLTHRAVLAIAVPVMISNVSTPLLGIVDTGVVGQIPNPAYIGAVAVGSLVFTFVFWAFGFLRMGTTGLTAQAHGAQDGDEVAAALGRVLLIAAAKLTTIWAVGIALLLSAMFALLGAVLIDVLTVDPDTRTAARIYLPWMALVPFLGVWAFQLDGIFIGATRTADMRNAMLAALAIYLAAWWLLKPFGNHWLWAALYVSYFARAGTLLWYYPRLVRSVPV